jgi:hypothetical protein
MVKRLGRNHFEQVRLVLVLADVRAPDRDGHDLRAAGLDGRARLVHRLVLAGADEQARVVGLAGNAQYVVHL